MYTTTIENTISRLKKTENMEDKLFALSGAFGAVPISVSYESWNGLEVRLTECGESTVFDPIHWRINVNDIELIEKLHEQLKYIDHSMITIINKVWMHPTLGLHMSFMEAQDTDMILKRWERFNTWMLKHFPDYAKKGYERAFDWQNPKELPENIIAWAVRYILYGVKASDVGIRLLKERKADISEAGIMSLKKDSGLVTRWHFKSREDRKKGDPSEIDSFGLSGSISMCFARAFSEDKDIITCAKVPEQWEVDANVYIGIETTKKKSLFK